MVDPVDAVADCHERIDAHDSEVRAVLELAHDGAWGDGRLAGVPFLVKGNVEVAGRRLATTAGSAAMTDAAPPRANAPALQRLLDEGANLIGTANLSEWANFRSTHSSSGWSALGGQCRNPHDLSRSPGGSSAGSAAAVAAGFVPFALGTETDGSVVCPASLCGVVGVKTTLGLIPTAGVIPISSSQDTVGPIARTTADAALVLSVLAGIDVPLSADALRGARIGVGRSVYCGYDAAADAALEAALSVLSRLGATIVDPADVTTAADLRDTDHELTVLKAEFKDELAAYLATRPGGPRDLGELIAWNAAHPDVELAQFDQDILEACWATDGKADPAYARARAECIRLARTDGLDATLTRHGLDALVWPTYPQAWLIGPAGIGDGAVSGAGSTPTAVAGYPAVTVPSGVVDGLPTGILFAGPAGSDARLLGYAHAYEQATHHLARPPLG
jgi:amidase